MSFYLDTNVLVSLFLKDTNSRRVESWLESKTDGRFVVSQWTRAEFAAVALRGARRGNFSADYAAMLIADFGTWQQKHAGIVELSPAAGTLCVQLAAVHGLKLSAPDALHLALATIAQVTLVTLDVRLAEAARARNHSVVGPEVLMVE